MQWTMTMTNPSKESKTAKRIWKSAERRSVMARTADIQVRASRGSTTQELQRDALEGRRRESSAPPHPLPGGALAQPPDPTRLQRVFPANISVWETFPEHPRRAGRGFAHSNRRDSFPTVQSCIKLEVGRKDVDPSLPLPRPPHCAPNPPRLFPREGDEIQSLQVAKGKGNSCSRDWSVTMAVGSQTLGLPQHMEDTNTGTCHALE